MSRIISRVIPLLTAAVLAGAVLVPVSATPAAAREGSTFVSVVNRYRANAGVGPVSLHSVVDRIAIERADQLAAAKKLGHDMEYVKKRLSEAGVCWQRLGEIVAYNGKPASERIERFVYQWYHSDGHRKIMLGPDYTHAGGSYTTASNGYHYAAMIFIKLCGASTTSPAPSSPTPTFTDISASKFRSDILWLAAEGITNGCTATTYCPKGLVARDQMATFLRRAIELPGTSKNYFSDIWGNKHAGSINAVRAAGLTSGCGGTKFCPSGKVTRGQMASFLARALNLPRASRDYFWDDRGSVHEDAINRVAQAKITFGCDTGRYCPGGLVNREQMAAFLRRAFE